MAVFVATRESPTTAPTLGWWDGDEPPNADPAVVQGAIRDIRRPVILLRTSDGLAVADNGTIRLDAGDGSHAIAAIIPACRPEQLGDPSFLTDHGLRYPYVAGAMA